VDAGGIKIFSPAAARKVLIFPGGLAVSPPNHPEIASFFGGSPAHGSGALMHYAGEALYYNDGQNGDSPITFFMQCTTTPLSFSGLPPGRLGILIVLRCSVMHPVSRKSPVNEFFQMIGSRPIVHLFVLRYVLCIADHGGDRVY
jgi:hypothetical protein